MVKRTPLSVLALIVSIGSQVAAVAQFQLGAETFPTPPSWRDEFFVLIAISLAATLGLFWLARGGTVLVLLATRTLATIVASVPEPKYGGIEMTLVAGLVVEAAVYPSSRVAVWAAAVVVALASASLIPLRVWDSVTAPIAEPQIIAFELFIVLAAIVSLAARSLSDALAGERKRSASFNETVIRLTSANIGFQHYASTIGERSTEEERRRVSREIHDTIGYTLTNIKMMIEVALDSLHDGDSPRLGQVLETMKAQALSGLSEARKSLHALRSVETQDVGGLRLFHRLTEAFTNATGVSVEVNFGNAEFTYGDDIDQTVYRMLQEGMTNAFRHGKATRITVNFWHSEGALYIMIRDNGSGAGKIDEGIGLAGMSERISKLHGTLRAHDVADGFQLLATIPVAAGRGTA